MLGSAGTRGRSPEVPPLLRACPGSAQPRPTCAVCSSASASSSPSTSSRCSSPAGRAAGECPGVTAPLGAEPMGTTLVEALGLCPLAPAVAQMG